METCHESVTVPIDRLIELRILILIFSFYAVIFLSLFLSLCLISFSLFPRSLKLDSKSFKAPHSYLVHPFLDDVQSKHKIFCVSRPVYPSCVCLQWVGALVLWFFLSINFSIILDFFSSIYMTLPFVSILAVINRTWLRLKWIWK